MQVMVVLTAKRMQASLGRPVPTGGSGLFEVTLRQANFLLELVQQMMDGR
jgi:hypothetical protein